MFGFIARRCIIVRHRLISGAASALLLAVLPLSCADAPAPPTESFELRAARTGVDYRIDLYLPKGYSPTGAPLPVLYQLDGDSQASPVAALLDAQSREVVVVGIGYPANEHLERLRDYTPTQIKGGEPGAGGLGEFSLFLRDELVPRIERDYNVSQDRALMGHSLGGLATTLIFLEQPSPTFSKFAAISPSLWWDDGEAFKREAAQSMAQSPPSGRLFIAYGQLEPSDIALTSEAFATRLKAREYEEASIKLRSLDDAEHLETWSRGYPEALEWLYAK